MPFVHPTAVVDEDVELGQGTQVWHFVHVSSGARIGKNCILGQNVFVGRHVRIGDGVSVQNNVSIYERVEIQDDAFLGPSCVFTNVRNPRSFVNRKDAFEATLVRTGATVGANATILCGHELGAYCLVGAGSLTLGNVPAHALVVGSPARQIGWVCRCGESLSGGPLSDEGAYRCGSCGDSYAIEDGSCSRIE